jgi:hypothetical protein
MAVDLADFEKRVNSDPALRQKFLDDPVKTLADEGLVLSKDMEANLQKFVGDLKNPPTQVSGASVAQKGAVADVGIGVSIGKSF